MATAKDKLDVKIGDLLGVLEDNKKVIRRQDKMIVDLQQKNDVSQSSIAEAAEETQKRTKEKINLKMYIMQKYLL